MKEFGFIVIAFSLFSMTVIEFGFLEDIQKTAQTVHEYEYKSLALSKELRLLKLENKNLQVSISEYKAQKEHLAFQLQNATKNTQPGQRAIASVPKKLENDLVDFDVYKWSPEKLLGVGEKALHFKDWEKSAQFFNALVEKYPEHKTISAQVLFQAGIAAYESQKHYEWATSHFESVIKKYPLSKYVRGAKLWLALSHHHNGDDQAFMQAVDEFRLKYRNTKEWKILSQYYEDIAGKYGI